MSNRILHFLFVFLLLIITQMNVRFCHGIYDPRDRVNNKVGVHILFTHEVEEAAELVNSNGGDWGYIIIPIQSTDRNLVKWQEFMDDCKKYHLIPILRIATFVKEDYWTKNHWYEEVDFANFLDSLSWPVENRYVVIYNEPNRAKEWGDILDPGEYARVLSTSYDVFKRVNKNFFILPAGFDAAAPSNGVLMDEYEYLRKMAQAVPDVFTKMDGWASHSYPNPNFSGACADKSRMSIAGYRQELAFLKDNYHLSDLPVFITETGWRQDTIKEDVIASNYQCAFSSVWNDKNVAAVTVFLLHGEGLFDEFSLFQDGDETAAYKVVANITKKKGAPGFEKKKGEVAGISVKNSSSPPFYYTGINELRARFERVLTRMARIFFGEW